MKMKYLSRIFVFQGQGIERLLVKGKKDQLDEVDGHPYKYFLLAGTTDACDACD